MAEKTVKTDSKPKVAKPRKKAETVSSEVEAIVKPLKKSAVKSEYFEAVGRRKTATARVRLSAGFSGLEVNGKSFQKYFPLLRLQKKAFAPLEKTETAVKMGATVMVNGGGIAGQADAVSLGVARALVKFNPELRERFRRLGYLTRDARAVERKKFGLKKARRAPQWVKR